MKFLPNSAVVFKAMFWKQNEIHASSKIVLFIRYLSLRVMQLCSGQFSTIMGPRRKAKKQPVRSLLYYWADINSSQSFL